MPRNKTFRKEGGTKNKKKKRNIKKTRKKYKMKVAFLTAGGIAPCLSASIGRLICNYTEHESKLFCHSRLRLLPVGRPA